MILYPNILRSHLVTIAPMAPLSPKSTSKLKFALHCSYSIVILRFIPALLRLKPNNHYNHGFHITFDNNHFTNSDQLLYTMTASAHIIRYEYV